MGDIPKHLVNFVKWVVPLLLFLFPPNSSSANTTIVIPPTVQCFLCVQNCDADYDTPKVLKTETCYPVPQAEPIGVGCIIAEYWDQTASHLVWTDQRCLSVEDVVGKWSMRRIVGGVWGFNLTNVNLRTAENPGYSSQPTGRRHRLGNTCIYFQNLRNGETVEKCYCSTTQCNKDMITAGGVGKATFVNSGSKLSKSWAAYLLGSLVFWITR